MTTRLSVNVDHVATLRQARRAPYPDPVEAAALAEAAGASGITAHLRADRRHIQDHDVARLRERVRGKLNLELAPTEEMLALAARFRPDQVSLVPERSEEVTTEGGLDVVAQGERVLVAARRLTEAGIAVSVFLDPDLRQIDALTALAERARDERGRIVGFEINTDAYTKAAAERAVDLAKVAAAARHGAARGFAVYAGHGLTPGNVGAVAALPEVEELNIGHGLISRAVMVGMTAAVAEYLAAMARG